MFTESSRVQRVYLQHDAAHAPESQHDEPVQHEPSSQQHEPSAQQAHEQVQSAPHAPSAQQVHSSQHAQSSHEHASPQQQQHPSLIWLNLATGVGRASAEPAARTTAANDRIKVFMGISSRRSGKARAAISCEWCENLVANELKVRRGRESPSFQTCFELVAQASRLSVKSSETTTSSTRTTWPALFSRAARIVPPARHRPSSNRHRARSAASDSDASAGHPDAIATPRTLRSEAPSDGAAVERCTCTPTRARTLPTPAHTRPHLCTHKTRTPRRDELGVPRTHSNPSRPRRHNSRRQRKQPLNIPRVLLTCRS